jgi:hypothetical protein
MEAENCFVTPDDQEFLINSVGGGGSPSHNHGKPEGRCLSTALVTSLLHTLTMKPTRQSKQLLSELVVPRQPPPLPH